MASLAVEEVIDETGRVKGICPKKSIRLLEGLLGCPRNWSFWLGWLSFPGKREESHLGIRKDNMSKSKREMIEVQG